MKFKYGDKVIIVEGFYEGCKGLVIDYSKVYGGLLFYNIEINKHIGNNVKQVTVEVRENVIKLLSREVQNGL